jgi:hypothetical protein
MAEWLASLPAMQVAQIRSPVPAGPTISVEKGALIWGHILKHCNQDNS